MIFPFLHQVAQSLLLSKDLALAIPTSQPNSKLIALPCMHESEITTIYGLILDVIVHIS